MTERTDVTTHRCRDCGTYLGSGSMAYAHLARCADAATCSARQLAAGREPSTRMHAKDSADADARRLK